MKTDRPVRIQSLDFLGAFRVRLEFTDGSSREIDLDRYLHGPIFEDIRNNPDVFRSAKIDARMGAISWDNGADIDPDVLYHDLTPAWMESDTDESQVA
ncbi:MAG: DUF2442 domain-containing protein [Syntrophobacteraceae bacterium]|nr:DUF2442 domain-containing protein [Syntrophobacteraceae bacterium]